MILKELIEKLNEFDPDSEIVIETEGDFILHVKNIFSDSLDDLNKEVHIILDQN